MKNFKLHYALMSAIIVLANASNAQTSSNQLWVTFEHSSAVPSMVNGKLHSNNQNVQQLIEQYAITSIEQAVPDSRQEKLQRVYEVTCFCNGDALAEAMERNAEFSKPERAPEYELLNLPDDYDVTFTDDYALDLIRAEEAWTYSLGDPTVVIGVSDGSFYDFHEELQNKVVAVTNSTTATIQYYHHGTAVAITAAGGTNNAQGKSSIGYNCNLSLNTIGYNQLLQLSYGGSRVINVSWASGCYYNSYYQDIIDEIYNNGSILVVAAGNGGTCGGPTALVYPAALDHVIAVSSIGPSDNHERQIGNPASTHQHNSSVDLCAPGYDVALSPSPLWYMTGNGSSFAAPYVSGTIGLMLSIRPCLTFEDVLGILQLTAVNIDAQNPAYVGTLGAGRLDAGAALAYTASNLCDLIAPQVENNGGLITGNNGVGTDPTGDGNNGHGNDDGSVDTSNPGNGGGPTISGNNGNNGEVPTISGNNGNNGGTITNDNGGVKGNTGGTISPDIKNQTGTISSEGGSEEGGGHRTGDETGMDLDALPFEAHLFPNPSESTSKLVWNQSGTMQLQVFASNGAIVLEETIAPEERSIELNMEQKGVYYIRMVKENDHVWTTKWVRI